ncbi:hypothetical protein, partial [uncultured Muribaculum sp.]|uniref:hypothetical protein n=1 Tax=uncultured Muribaculum sp. TaxID=1918613 RepID=UPI002711D6CD
LQLSNVIENKASSMIKLRPAVSGLVNNAIKDKINSQKIKSLIVIRFYRQGGSQPLPVESA